MNTNNNMDNVVRVVMATDDAYVIPTYISIFSMMDCSNNMREYQVYILCNQVSVDNKQKLNNISKDLFKVECIDIKPEWLSSVEKIPNIPATKSSLLKFCIPDVFPDFDKMLFLDGDTLIKKDIAILFDIDINNEMAAVVRDINLLNKKPKNEKLDLRKSEEYFNSGVMLLNLKEFRDKEVTKQLIDYRTNKENYLMDQDAFNAVLRQYPLLYMDVYYNFMVRAISTASLDVYREYYNIENEMDVDSILDRIVVFHFASYKPWKHFDLLFAEQWLNYYKKSPFSNLKLCRTSFYYEKIYRRRYYKLYRIIDKQIGHLRKGFR